MGRERNAPVSGVVLCSAYAGLRNQGLGLAEAAGVAPRVEEIRAMGLWRQVPPAWWPAPVAARMVSPPPERLAIGVGGAGAAVVAALRRRGHLAVQVQHPRMPLDRFDLIVANRHDEIAGPNVVMTRTALHRATAARLAEARGVWGPRLAHLPRPLVSVLVGGSNGRFRLEAREGEGLAGAIAGMMRRDRVGVAVTPSRRTAPAARAALEATLGPLGAWVWDMEGENPYFGLLACADAIVVTIDSISMVSEAVATEAPVLLASLPGRSRRIALFLRGLREAGRVRDFAGRMESWGVTPLDDTGLAGEALLACLQRAGGFSG